MYQLVRKPAKGGKTKVLKNLPKGKYADSNDWELRTISGKYIFLTCGNFSQWKQWTYTYNIKTRKLKKIQNNCSIVQTSGKYAVGINGYRTDISPQKMTLYKITSAGKLKKIKVIDNSVASIGIHNKQIYYMTFSDYSESLYKCNRDGKKIKKIATFEKSSPYNIILASDFKSDGCTITYNPGGQYYLNYQTLDMTPIYR